jgi:hypothetical protein
MGFLMSATIYIDVKTGAAQRSDGTALPAFRFYLRDILSLGIVFVDGASIVTAATLAGPAAMRLGLRAIGGDGLLLASCLTYNLAGNVAACVFNLNTNELIAYFAANVPAQNREAQFAFEIEVTAADASIRQTYHQSACAVSRDINQPADIAPTPAAASAYVLIASLFDGNNRGIASQFVAFRSEIATIADIRALSTVLLTRPWAFDVSITDDDRRYKLRTRGGGEVDDGNFFLVPTDYNASTNPVIFVRTR